MFLEVEMDIPCGLIWNGRMIWHGNLPQDMNCVCRYQADRVLDRKSCR